MDQGLIGILVLCGVSVVTGAIFHIKLKGFWAASILAALTASVIFQIIGYLVLGYLDPFFMIALVTGGFLALVAAVLIGLSIRYFRRRGPHQDRKR